jgi:hypothetical protein
MINPRMALVFGLTTAFIAGGLLLLLSGSAPIACAGLSFCAITTIATIIGGAL